MMKICAVVVTYNRLKLLKECLKHLLNQNYKLEKIVVFNNNSSDGTTSYLNKLNNDKILVYNSSVNLGGAGGFSQGTKIAYKKTDANYFWLMDDDTISSKNALFALIQKAKNIDYNFGFLCSNVRWWKNHKAALTNIPHPAVDWNESLISNLVKVSSTSFVSVLFSRKLVYKLGLPLAQMFIWGDDVEFTTRLSHYNPNSYLVANSIVFHKSKNNINYNIINSPRIKYYKYGVRNKIYILRKYSTFHKIIKKILSYIFVMCKIPFFSKDHRCKRLFYVLVGIFNGFLFNPKVKFINK